MNLANLPTFLAATFCSAFLFAQEPTPPQTPPPEIPAPQAPPLAEGTLGLTLEDCLRLAMQNNQGLQDVRWAVESVDTTIQEQLGFFDPSYFATVGGGQSEIPTADRL